MELIVKDCREMLENINKHKVVKKVGEKLKIDIPDLTYRNGIIKMNKNTKLRYMNVIIPTNYGRPLDFKKLTEFSKKFPYFIVEVPKNILKKDENENKIENSIKIRYKRISGFVNMNDILFEIDKLKEKGLENGFIIKLLEKKYQKTIEEIKKYMIEWEKKYSSTKSKKISSEFKQGILITITESKILIHGITKIFQLPLLYKFCTTFMTLFINYDNFIKNSVFKKIFTGKNTINDKNVLENSYEYNEEIKLDLGKINYTYYDIEGYEEDEDGHNNNIDLENEEYNKKNKKAISLYSNENVVGKASLDQVDPNIYLTCEDAVPEKGTCADFCNDEYYFIRRLQLYDLKLFKPNKGIKGKYEKYTRSCQSKRQPAVLPFDPEKDPRIKRESYSFAIKYSSDPDSFQRWYICPKIWCPYCEIPIAESDIDKSTIKVRMTKEQGSTCKTAICPYGDHLVFIKDKENEEHIYPGFASKDIHPQGLCLPCCFKKSQSDPKKSGYAKFKKCLGEENESSKNVKEGQIYILGKGIPIEKNRYGKLNLELDRILKTNLETGYLGNKSGYLRKGIFHVKNNSFLSAISDIISCDKGNKSMDINKLKHILVEKLNETLFKSLHGGNLQNIFFNIENYKKFILNENIVIDHKYLWDYLQRENILVEEGLNIFIFENNNLLCPKGENIEFYYNKNRRNILLFKSNQYYEPIYYLEGLGKTAKIDCLFDFTREEIRKIYDISKEGCKNYDKIDWLELLKTNIKKYGIKIDNYTLTNGTDLQTTLNQLFLAIKDKKLTHKYLPEIQYMDTYNKVFGLKLNNGLYLPINTSKLDEKIKYKLVIDLNDINKLSFKDTLKYTNEIAKNTKIDCKINDKILDLKYKKNIIALVNKNNRFIPIEPELNKDKDLNISYLNYYSDIDESIFDKIEKTDNRIEVINKKKYEDETYIRLKFELAKFLQNKNNKIIQEKILELIDSNEKDIVKKRNIMYKLLDSIYSIIVSFKKDDIDYYEYTTPNKRIPCELRKAKNINKNNEIILSCEEDPHCVMTKKGCRLFVNETNLIHTDRKIDNYNFYLSKIVDELLRYRIKRYEILKDNIPVIVNKEYITENRNKYYVIHTNQSEEINDILDELYFNNDGILIDTKNLYEEITTKEIGFKKEKYLKTTIMNIENTGSDELSQNWIKILGEEYKVRLNTDDSLFTLLSKIINSKEFKENRNNQLIDIQFLKNKIIDYINTKKNKANILKLYSINKETNNIPNIDILKQTIMEYEYKGSEVDIDFISKIYDVNFIILDKKLKKNKVNLEIIKTKNYKTDYFVLLYRTNILDKNIYNLIQSRGKIIYRFNEFPEKFVKLIDSIH